MQQLKDEAYDNFTIKTVKSKYSPNRYMVYLFEKDSDQDEPRFTFMVTAKDKKDLVNQVKIFLKKQNYKADEHNAYVVETIEEYDDEHNKQQVEEW
jgi:hypothetical protein